MALDGLLAELKRKDLQIKGLEVEAHRLKSALAKYADPMNWLWATSPGDLDAWQGEGSGPDIAQSALGEPYHGKRRKDEHD